MVNAGDKGAMGRGPVGLSLAMLYLTCSLDTQMRGVSGQLDFPVWS